LTEQFWIPGYFSLFRSPGTAVEGETLTNLGAWLTARYLRHVALPVALRWFPHVSRPRSGDRCALNLHRGVSVRSTDGTHLLQNLFRFGGRIRCFGDWSSDDNVGCAGGDCLGGRYDAALVSAISAGRPDAGIYDRELVAQAASNLSGFADCGSDGGGDVMIFQIEKDTPAWSHQFAHDLRAFGGVELHADFISGSGVAHGRHNLSGSDRGGHVESDDQVLPRVINWASVY